MSDFRLRAVFTPLHGYQYQHAISILLACCCISVRHHSSQCPMDSLDFGNSWYDDRLSEPAVIWSYLTRLILKVSSTFASSSGNARRVPLVVSFSTSRARST